MYQHHQNNNNNSNNNNNNNTYPTALHVLLWSIAVWVHNAVQHNQADRRAATNDTTSTHCVLYRPQPKHLLPAASRADACEQHAAAHLGPCHVTYSAAGPLQEADDKAP
jgi:hypothetical protein